MAGELFIVIVEGPCFGRNVLCRALASWGYAYFLAEDEAAAWSAVTAVRGPTVVLADWQVDFMECEKFFLRIRRQQDLGQIHLMGAIPRGAPGAIRQCVRAGADDVVSVPYDLDEVRLRLHTARKLLGLSPGGAVFS
ncbi:MAG: response regulator [Desulfovibrionales bacterium]|nr:response regulator [Desulfovibrionales bacterium]